MGARRSCRRRGLRPGNVRACSSRDDGTSEKISPTWARSACEFIDISGPRARRQYRARCGGRTPGGRRRDAADVEMARPRSPRRRPVPDGARSGGDERFDLAAGRGLRHDGDHDPGSDRALRPGNGHADAHRRQARRPLGPAAGVPDRAGHLRVGLGPDRGLMERADAHPRLVGPRGNRGGPRDAGARRPGGGQLRGQGQGAGLRNARRCGERRDRRRSDPGRVGDDGVELARHLRRRGGGWGGDPARVTLAPRPSPGRPGAAPGLASARSSSRSASD